MKRNTPVYLISQEYEKNNLDVYVHTETRKKIFAQITSVSGAEWFEGGRNGLNPEFRAQVHAFEYRGEEILEKDGQRYSIYRTFQSSPDTIELYCEKKKGAE